MESWNTQLEELTGVPRQRSGRTGAWRKCCPPTWWRKSPRMRTTSASPASTNSICGTARAGTLVVNVSMAPLVGKSGERVGRLILVDDITQRMRLEEQLLQTEKLTSLGLLAAGVAHEVNTPLAVISNYIQMLAKQLPADDPRHKLIDKIVKQTFRASEIVNNLLNFSRTGRGGIRRGEPERGDRGNALAGRRIRSAPRTCRWSRICKAICRRCSARATACSRCS